MSLKLERNFINIVKIITKWKLAWIYLTRFWLSGTLTFWNKPVTLSQDFNQKLNSALQTNFTNEYQPKSMVEMADFETLTLCISLSSSQMCTSIFIDLVAGYFCIW